MGISQIVERTGCEKKVAVWVPGMGQDDEAKAL